MNAATLINGKGRTIATQEELKAEARNVAAELVGMYLPDESIDVGRGRRFVERLETDILALCNRAIEAERIAAKIEEDYDIVLADVEAIVDEELAEIRAVLKRFACKPKKNGDSYTGDCCAARELLRQLEPKER